MHDKDELDPRIQLFSASSMDISGYIASLAEPQRSICYAMVIRGESSKSVAGRFNVTPKTILRKTRKALAPLAMEYDIKTAAKHLPVSASVIYVKSDGKVTAHRGGAPQQQRSGGARKATEGQKGTPENDHPVRPLGK